MQIGGITTAYPLRSTNAPAAAAPAIPAADDRSARAKLLDALREVTVSDADDRKARAREKLEAAKKDLEFLRRWSFDPEIIARQAGRLGREVSAAARDFASALSAGSDSATSTGDAAAAASPEAGQITIESTEPDVSDEDTSFAEKAYRDTMESATERKTISAADRKTLEEFKAVAQEIKAILEDAIRRMREEKKADQNSIQEAQRAGADLDLAMQGLQSAAGSDVPGDAVAIPVSITI